MSAKVFWGWGAMARVAQVELMATHSVALNLAPLLAPHRKRGRLSLRLERIPQGTRLSRGTRNNDNTWSLASDELDDLALLMSAKPQQEFKIGVRVISLLDGSTLVTVDLPVKPGDEVAGVNLDNSATPTLSPADAAELSVLRQELAAAKETLATRDAELAERLAAAATEASNQFQQTLAKAEAGWTESENARLAAIQQQWQDKFAEALSEIDGAQTKAHEAQVRELQEKVDALQAVLDQSNAALEQAKTASATARERSDSATQDALTKLANVETKLSGVETKLAERQTALDHAVAATVAAKRDAEAALTKAEHAWRDGEAARLAAAEANWRETSAKALADAHAGAQALHAKGTAGERDLLNQMAELKAAIAERDEALTRAKAANEQARAKAAEAAASERAAAEATWKTAEAARLATVEAEWRAKLEDAVKVAPVELPAAPVPTPVDETELQDLRDKLSSLQAKLAMRDAAATRAAKLAEDEHRRWQKEAQDVVVKAARERKSDENARLAALQSEWTKQSVRELALASARAEAAEAALAQLRIRATEEAPIQREIASLRSALAIREAELEHYRPKTTEEVAPSDDAAAQTPVPNPRGKRMMSDALVAACVGMIAVILWPVVSNLIESQSRAVPPAAPVAAVETPQPVLAVAIASKDSKLRATPSIYGKFVGKLPHDVKVERVEVKGEWTRVRRTDTPARGEPVEGWAKSSVLSDLPVAPAKPAKSKKKK